MCWYRSIGRVEIQDAWSKIARTRASSSKDGQGLGVIVVVERLRFETLIDAAFVSHQNAFFLPTRRPRVNGRKYG